MTRNNLNHPPALRLTSCYKKQFSSIEIILVEKSVIEVEGLDKYSNYFKSLSGLKTILLLLDGDNKEARTERAEEEDKGNNNQRTHNRMTSFENVRMRLKRSTRISWDIKTGYGLRSCA
jgi:hypothetical protein